MGQEQSGSTKLGLMGSLNTSDPCTTQLVRLWEKIKDLRKRNSKAGERALRLRAPIILEEDQVLFSHTYSHL